MWRIKVVHGSSQGCPNGPGGGGGGGGNGFREGEGAYVKSNFHLILQNAGLDFNQTYM